MKKKFRVALCLLLALSVIAMPITSLAATSTIKKPVVTVKSVDDNYLKISWKKCTGATKYAVYRATSKTGKYKKLTTTTKLYYYDDTGKNKTTYYYKVMALGKNSKKSAYSAIKSGKINFTGKITVNLEYPELSLGLGEVRMAYVNVKNCDDDIIAYFDGNYIDVVWNQGVDGEYPLEIWVEDCKPFPFETKIVFKFANHERLYSKTLYVTIE